MAVASVHRKQLPVVTSPVDFSYLFGYNANGEEALLPSGFALAAAPEAGFAGTGTIHKSGVERCGQLITTKFLIDLTGLASVATDNDIIGVGANPAHFGKLSAAVNGTVYAGFMRCLETPAGGEIDFNVWSADEGTGVLDGLITGLTGELTLFDRAGDWAAGNVLACGAVVPTANQYLYLAVGTSSTPTAGTYTAGKFLIELFGYVP